MAKSQSVDEMMKEYRRLAKVADQRMLRLEQYQKRAGYENVLKYSYAKAQHDLKRWANEKRLKSGKPLRFNTKPPMNKNGTISKRLLKEKITQIKTFLASDTSTLVKPAKPKKENKEKPEIISGEGINAVFQSKADSINNEYGTNFTWETLAKYFEDGTADKLANKYGSKTALRIIAQIQKKPDEVVRELSKVDERRIKTDNPFLSKKVNEVLNEYGTDIESLIKY